MLSSDTVKAYFDPQAEHELHIDGFPVGLAATLTQRKPGKQCWRVVQYASRSLKDPEKRYSQIESEALAGDFGCKKFHLFLYGRPFNPLHTNNAYLRKKHRFASMNCFLFNLSYNVMIMCEWH